MQDLIHNQQIIHPIALAVLIAAGILILALPRKYALIPFFFAAIFIPIQQRILIFEIDFYTLRLLLTFTLARVFLRGEYSDFRINLLDATIIGTQFVRFLAYSILWSTPHAFLTGLATAVDGLGIYLILRFLIRSLDDIVFTLKSFAILFLCLLPFIFHEFFTGENVFHIFGGDKYSWIRGDNIRARGPFRHTLTLGAFCPPFIALFIYLLFLSKVDKYFAIVGIISVLFITYSTGSSTSYGAVLACIFFTFFFLLRKFLKHMIYLIILILSSIQVYWFIFKSKPIWALMGYGAFFPSSNTAHRYHLFDQFIKRVDEWWLIGTKSTAHWWYWTYDQNNQFVWIGANGGIFVLALFVFSIYISFKIIGKSIEILQSNTNLHFFLWTLGAALSTHLVSFWGINYYDQSGIGLMLLFAIIACTADLNYQISQNLFATLLHPQPDTRQLATDSR